jgi:RND family efflux transporter MFP subunit
VRAQTALWALDFGQKKRFVVGALFMDEPTARLDELRIERTDRPESSLRIGLWLACAGVVLLLGGAGAWLLTRSRGIEVRTAAARETGAGGLERVVLNASGYVTARRAATVSSKVTGKVTEVLIEEGMRVQEDQTLARLDDANVRASLRLAEAQLLSATNALAETRVRIREADQELDRQAALVKNKIATQADFDHAEAAALAYKARLQQQTADVLVAERTVATWQQQLDDTLIRAPFGGIVTSKNAQPGEMISPISAGGGFTRTGICTIVDMQSLEIEIDVNESYINRVEPGQSVEASLDAYPDWKIPCKVIAIIPTADRQKSTVKVRVGFIKLEPRILPDMSVKVAFRESGGAAPATGRMVAVPKTAVRQLDGHDVVFVVRDSRAERRAVTVSSTGADDAVISAGISAGEKVALAPSGELADGTAVREKR